MSPEDQQAAFEQQLRAAIRLPDVQEFLRVAAGRIAWVGGDLVLDSKGRRIYPCSVKISDHAVVFDPAVGGRPVAVHVRVTVRPLDGFGGPDDRDALEAPTVPLGPAP